MKYQTILFALMASSLVRSDEIEVIKSISNQIGDIVLQCQNEINFGPMVILEFLEFWNTAHVLGEDMLGCAVACVINKLGLISHGAELKDDNTDAFLMANGADDETIGMIKELCQVCIDAALSKTADDGCLFALELAKCFRYGIFSLKWAPPYLVKDEPKENGNEGIDF